jgi:hypothetical protein
MGIRRHAAVATAAVVAGWLVMPPLFLAIPGPMSPALAQPATVTKPQPDAVAAYDEAVKNFAQVLAQRRAQIDARQPLPSRPGQALYLARNAMIGAAKDLTDAVPSRAGGHNKFGIPPAYYDAGMAPLLDEYRKIFDVLEAPPAMRRPRRRHTRMSSISALPSHAQGDWTRRMPRWRA